MITDKKTILIVEDDVIIAMAESHALTKTGYNVISVSTGENAIDVLFTKNKTVDLILMDIDLGKGMDGIDTAQEILKRCTLPILFLSSHIEKDIVEKTETITSYGYVVKNSSITVLDASMKMAFKLFDAKQSQQKQIDEINELYNNAPCGYHSIDENGFFQRINDTELSWLGYRREELLGIKKITDLLTPDSLEVFNQAFPALKEKASFNDLELSFYRKNGTILPVLLSGNAVYDSAGEHLLSRSILIDNTARLKTEFSLRKYQHELEVQKLELEMQNEELKLAGDRAEITAEKYSLLYERSPVGYFAFDREGTILELNDRSAAMFGRDKSSLVGSNFRFFIENNDRLLFDTFIQKTFSSGIDQPCILSIQMESSEPFSISLMWINSPDKEKVFMAAFDITELKKAQKKVSVLEAKCD